MNKKIVTWMILISLFFGSFGSWFLTRYLIPKLDTLPFLVKYNLTPPSGPLVINTREEVRVDSSQDLVTAIQSAKPWTVAVLALNTAGSVQTLGTGLVLTSDGLIATTQTAINNQTNIWVKTISGSVYQATVKSTDPASGLVFLQAAGLKNQPIASFNDPNSMQLGDGLALISQSAGQYQATTQLSYLSSETRNTPTDKVLFSDSIERTFAVGPLQQAEEGSIIIYGDGGVEGIYSKNGIIVAGTIQSALNSYFNNNDSIVRPGLGIYYEYISPDIAAITSSKEGVLVKQSDSKTPAVVAGSPAQQAGIQAGDLIYSVNGNKINFDNPLESLVLSHLPNDVLTLNLVRGGKDVVINVILKADKSK